MSLTAFAITELTTETAPKLLLAEWLGDWFDGQPHVVSAASGVEHTFPSATVNFDQGEVTNPLNGLEIRIIIDPQKGTARGDENGKLAQEDVIINFWIRAKKTQSGAGNGNFLANNASDLLVGILNNPDARYPLSQKGLVHLRAPKGKTFEDNQYAIRHVKCRAQMQYAIRF